MVQETAVYEGKGGNILKNAVLLMPVHMHTCTPRGGLITAIYGGCPANDEMQKRMIQTRKKKKIHLSRVSQEAKCRPQRRLHRSSSDPFQKSNNFMRLIIR